MIVVQCVLYKGTVAFGGKDVRIFLVDGMLMFSWFRKKVVQTANMVGNVDKKF